KGAGQSTMAASHFAPITTGGNWPDGTPAPLGDVLVWSAEDDFADTILPRFLAAGGDKGRLYAVGNIVGTDGAERPFDPATDIPDLLDTAKRLPDLRAILIDPIVMAVAGDSHKNSETR